MTLPFHAARSISGACAANKLLSTNRTIVCKKKMKPYGSAFGASEMTTTILKN